ncbi:MAG TPA: ABC transporter ATP-binding protein [Lentisphaeria bacterium]|nr:ABC transporter ATP-binding protein [Lentisphaeria bacterium]
MSLPAQEFSKQTRPFSDPVFLFAPQPQPGHTPKTTPGDPILEDFLWFKDITKDFGATRAVDNVSLTVRRGEIFSLLGPSGCGKTTLLRMLAGFEVPDTGRIILENQDITDLPPNLRRVNTIFQNYALFPHMTVRENIAFGLKVAKKPKAIIAAEVDRMLAMIQMQDHADKRPAQISGGQKQRVAIARALVLKPNVLLLDEPLAALDLKLRQKMLLELSLIHDEVGITFIYVTHDQGEAMSISDRIAVMNNGRIEQIGTPAEIYEAPKSSFVAAFIGDTNFFDGRITEVIDPEYCRISVPDLPDMLCFNDKKLAHGDLVHLSIRPEKFQISLDPPHSGVKYNVLRGIVEDIIYQGNHTRYWVNVGEDWRISISRQHTRFMLDEKPINWHDKVFISWFADDGFMLERYSEKDEELLPTPPQTVGESDAPVEDESDEQEPEAENRP